MLSARVGDLSIHVLSAGSFKLDGGAMFGVVPKVVWQECLPPDEMNRVTLGLNCLLVTSGDGTRVLVDTGMGDRWSERDVARFGIDRLTTLRPELTALDLTPDDIDIVVLSHLHFDHAGGCTRTADDGRIVPVFVHARHVVQAREWEEAIQPHERHRASYRSADYLPLEEAGLVELVRDGVELIPGVRVELAGGHCPGMQVVRVESRGELLIFPADLLPTSSHLRPAWTMGFDLDAVATVDARRKIMAEALERNALVCFDHDARTPLARLERKERDGREQVIAVPAGDQVAA